MKRLLAVTTAGVLAALCLPVVQAGTPLAVYDVTGMDITTTRAEKDYGWTIYGCTNNAVYDIYGSINDKEDLFRSDPDYRGSDYLSVIVRGVGDTPAITAGDSVTFTYLTASGGGSLTKKVFFPAIAVDYYRFYVGTDGCSYSEDSCATKLASTPTPTPTPTAAPTATAIPKTPTPAPTATAYVPSPTPTPVTHDVGIVEFEELSANPSSVTLDTSGGASRLYMKGDKMVLQFNPSSSMTWYYVMDISVGVTDGITWTGQTTAP